MSFLGAILLLLTIHSITANDGAIQVYSEQTTRWPQAVISYVAPEQLNEYTYFWTKVTEAMNIIEAKTCIQFVRVDGPIETPYLRIVTNKVQLYGLQQNEVRLALSSDDQVPDIVHKLAVAIAGRNSTITRPQLTQVEKVDNSDTKDDNSTETSSYIDEVLSFLSFIKTMTSYEVQYNNQTNPRFTELYPYISDKVRDEFEETYKCPSCSKTFKSLTGAMKPLTIDRDEDCEYRITVPEDYVIVFELVDDEECASKSCEYVHFDVYNGDRRLTDKQVTLTSKGVISARSEGNQVVVIKPASKNPDIKLSTLHYAAVKVKKVVRTFGVIEPSKELPGVFSRSWQIWSINASNPDTFRLNISKFMVAGETDCLKNANGLIHKEQLKESEFKKVCENHTLMVKQTEDQKVQIELFSENSSHPVLLIGNYESFYNVCMNVEHGCHHYCEGFIDGYRCGCDDGFQLGSDGKTCTGGWSDYIYSRSTAWFISAVFSFSLVWIIILAIVSRRMYIQPRDEPLITEKPEKCQSA